MKQNSNDSNTPFDVHQPGAKDTAPLPVDGWRGRVELLNRRLRKLPTSTLVGLAAVGGALAVIVLSSGARLLVPAPQTKDPAKVVAVANKKPVADARVYVVPEDEVAPLPAVQPGLSTASLKETRSAEVASADAASAETSADAEIMRQRRMEDQLAAERQRLEDRKRVIERELENTEIENKRLQEDKALEEQRRQERQRLLEERQQEDKRLAEEAKQETERRMDEQRQLEEEAKREEAKMAAAG
jgi:hypothetical protein